ncbi:unnamed protein product [Tuber aestivum]|uniref:Protein N-terminal glutamine amidohydrolase n=1 Tax=Tuber aestivum TaxID=59557 RepID=A0A292PQA0_9PEZI|nr:unnamed protein product [Tuber aestivum]
MASGGPNGGGGSGAGAEGGGSPLGVLNREELVYTRCYCEENIYCLVRDRVPSDSRKYFTVAFVSNAMKSIKTPPLPVTWDYHVLLIHHPPSALATIYDFDTTLPFPCPFAEYYTKTLYGPAEWEEYGEMLDPVQVRAYVANRPRFFRLVGASEYLRTFASTRKHMMNPGGMEGMWLADPPVYPPITCEMGEDTLHMFLDFGASGSGGGGGWGRIVDEVAFWSEFAGEVDGIKVEEEGEEEVRVHC